LPALLELLGITPSYYAAVVANVPPRRIRRRGVTDPMCGMKVDRAKAARRDTRRVLVARRDWSGLTPARERTVSTADGKCRRL
jgi:hypothetical protein